MAYYDPSRWIAPTDTLLTHTESKVMANKRAFSQPKRHSKSFLPLHAIELDVVLDDTRELLRLSLSIEKQGKVSINMVSGDEPLRKGHFNHGWHHNPDGRNIRPPNHMHFPTVNYPSLDRRYTYAYPVQSGTDYLSALEKFCNDTNISIHDVPLPLLRRLS